MSYVRMSTDNPLGFRPWASRIGGMSGIPVPGEREVKIQYSGGGMGQYIWRPRQAGGLRGYNPVELYVPSATTPGGAAMMHLPASLSGVARRRRARGLGWLGNGSDTVPTGHLSRVYYYARILVVSGWANEATADRNRVVGPIGNVLVLIDGRPVGYANTNTPYGGAFRGGASDPSWSGFELQISTANLGLSSGPHRVSAVAVSRSGQTYNLPFMSNPIGSSDTFVIPAGEESSSPGTPTPPPQPIPTPAANQTSTALVMSPLGVPITGGALPVIPAPATGISDLFSKMPIWGWAALGFGAMMMFGGGKK